MFSCHKSYPRLDRAVEEHIFPVKLHLFWKNDRWIWLKLAGAEASALATAAVCACTRCGWFVLLPSHVPRFCSTISALNNSRIHGSTLSSVLYLYCTAVGCTIYRVHLLSITIRVVSKFASVVPLPPPRTTRKKEARDLGQPRALAYLWSRYPQAEGGSAASKSVHSLVGGASASTWRWMDKIGRIPSARCIRLISSVLICASPAMCCSSSSTVFHHVGALHLWYLYRWPVCYSYATLRTYGTLGREKKRKEKES
jgi:hypothetical protein